MGAPNFSINTLWTRRGMDEACLAALSFIKSILSFGGSAACICGFTGSATRSVFSIHVWCHRRLGLTAREVLNLSLLFSAGVLIGARCVEVLFYEWAPKARQRVVQMTPFGLGPRCALVANDHTSSLQARPHLCGQASVIRLGCRLRFRCKLSQKNA